MADTDGVKGNADPAVEPKTEGSKAVPGEFDADALCKLVKFYFSDHNLYRDKHLYQLVIGSQNFSVPLTTLHSFKRMEVFQPYEKVRDILKNDCPGIVVNDQEEISRADLTSVAQIPKGMTDNTNNNRRILEEREHPRTLYVRGFPETLGNQHQTYIESYFARYTPVAVRASRKPRYEGSGYSGQFKGAAFVILETDDAAKEVLAGEKPAFAHEGVSYELEFMTKDEYEKGEYGAEDREEVALAKKKHGVKHAGGQHVKQKGGRGGDDRRAGSGARQYAEKSHGRGKRARDDDGVGPDAKKAKAKEVSASKSEST